MAHILVIDDDKTILRLLEFALQRAGHNVTTCLDGAEGLAQVLARQPDLVVADVMMPKMTGYEFCRQVRAQPVVKGTPIIMFSARFQPIDKQTALEAGATDYLPKTASHEALLERITELLATTDHSPPVVTQATVGLFSLRGGVGVTSLAVNLAVSLALSQQTRPALLDLAPTGGHAALLLGLRPTSSIMHALAAAKDSFSLADIGPHFIQHPSGVQLLASAPIYNQALSLADQRLAQLIAGLKAGFPCMILDLPHLLNADSAALLRSFDKIALVLSPDLPSLQSTAIALHGLVRLGIADDKITLVVNHILAQGALPMEIIQKTVKRPISVIVPFEPDMIKSVNSGRPLVLSYPHSAATVAIARLAETLLR